MDGLQFFGYGSAWALVGLFVVMILRGDIASKRELLDKDRQLAEKDRQLAKADEIHATDQRHIAELMTQLSIHAEVPRMIETTLRAFHDAATINDPPPEGDS